jgi:hypothetical protein
MLTKPDEGFVTKREGLPRELSRGGQAKISRPKVAGAKLGIGNDVLEVTGSSAIYCHRIVTRLSSSVNGSDTELKSCSRNLIVIFYYTGANDEEF